MGDAGLLVIAAMHLADRWRRPLREIMNMTVLEFALWWAFLNKEAGRHDAKAPQI